MGEGDAIRTNFARLVTKEDVAGCTPRHRVGSGCGGLVAFPARSVGWGGGWCWGGGVGWGGDVGGGWGRGGDKTASAA